jgi:hypothetical protein
MAKGAMKASDPNIIKTFGSVTEKLESDESFFGHGMIGGSGGANSNLQRRGESAKWARRGKSESQGGGVIFTLGKKPTKGAGFERFDARDEDRLFFGMKAASDCGNL